jgi:hypothetical protein
MRGAMARALLAKAERESGDVRSRGDVVSTRSLWLCSFGYACVLALFPWQDVRGGAASFVDLGNYLERYESIKISGALQRPTGGGLLEFFMREGGWFFLLLLSVKVGVSARPLFSFISFCTALYLCKTVSQKSKNLFCVALMFNPLMIDLVRSQLRSAVALSIVIISLSLRRRALFYAAALAAMSVHSFSFIAYGSQFLLKRFKRVETLLSRVLFAILCLLASLTFLLAKNELLTLLGDRRAGLIGEPPSLVFAAIWAPCLAFLVTVNYRGPRIYFGFAVIFACLFLAGTFLGQYSLRFLALAYPFIVVIAGSVRGRMGFLFLFYLLVLQLLYIDYWLKY